MSSIVEISSTAAVVFQKETKKVYIIAAAKKRNHETGIYDMTESAPNQSV